uniref:Beta-xylanase n=1 Tax=uncultured bacterium Contig87 TaxID=1393621 RepID=W0FQA6_9BACT|nr:endoxylanase [uncultured bacterium Contig87]
MCPEFFIDLQRRMFMKHLSARLTALVLALLICLPPLSSLAGETGKVSEDYDPLWALAEPYGFKLGGCFGFMNMGNKTYMEFLARHFNSLTCTNETKAYSLLDQARSREAEDGMPRMNYSQADQMIKWAQDHNIGVRGHVLVWDAYMTQWFFHEDYDESKPVVDQQTMRLRLASYIDQVITHFEEKFPGVIYCWDVVNEAIGDNPSEYDASDPRHLRTVRSGASNCFLDYVGSDYVEYAFLCARETVDRLGADIRLFYNDYNLFFPEKRAAACALAESIQAYAQNEDGSPRRLIDGMGMQGYMGGWGEQAGCLDPSIITNVKASIAKYASLGLEVQLTEMAVRNFDETREEEHNAFYSRLFSEVFMQANTEENSPLTAVCIWGLVDADPWSKGNYVWNLNSPYGCLLTYKYKIKTCFEAVYHTLGGN